MGCFNFAINFWSIDIFEWILRNLFFCMVILRYRLQLYGLVENKIQGDGNCQVYFFFFLFLIIVIADGVSRSVSLVYIFFSQFRSLSDQLYRSPEHHNFVREQVVNQVEI